MIKREKEGMTPVTNRQAYRHIDLYEGIYYTESRKNKTPYSCR